MNEIAEDIRKKKNGQAGSDGNAYLRTRRIELRVCQREYSQIEQYSESSGYSNVAQYLRESGLTHKHIESPSSRQRDRQKWLYELNRIGNNINQIARQLNSGHQPDEEILMVLMQIREMAEAVHDEAKASSGEAGR